MYHEIEAMADYGQVGIWDIEDNRSTPQWFSGNEYILFGTKAVTVQMASYADVRMVVCDEADQPQNRDKYITLASGPITVGGQGIAVGSGIGGDEKIALPSGYWHVEVWVDTPRIATTAIFVLKSLAPRYLGSYDFSLFCDLALSTSDPAQSLRGLVSHLQDKQYEHTYIASSLIQYAKAIRSNGDPSRYMIVHALIEELIGWDKFQG